MTLFVRSTGLPRVTPASCPPNPVASSFAMNGYPRWARASAGPHGALFYCRLHASQKATPSLSAPSLQCRNNAHLLALVAGNPQPIEPNADSAECAKPARMHLAWQVVGKPCLQLGVLPHYPNVRVYG